MDLAEPAFQALTFKQLQDECVGLNAHIEFETVERNTKITKISPAAEESNLIINPRISVPPWLLPGYQNIKRMNFATSEKPVTRVQGIYPILEKVG
jgi:hypothetical protein